MIPIAERSRELNPPLSEVYSKTGDAQEEVAAQEAMKRFVTNVDGNIFCYDPRTVPTLIASLSIARYSRTDLTARGLLWREFVKKQDIQWDVIDQGRAAVDEIFDFNRAEGLAERVLNAYGDDSAFETGPIHLFMNRVSQIAAKQIEDTRLGLSPIEKSTRYVIFDQPDASGDYSFHRDPKIMDSDHQGLYLETNRACFEVYAQSVQALIAHLKTQTPIESKMWPDLSDPKKPVERPYNELDESSARSARNAYNSTIRAGACDIARVLLPATTLTNIGAMGNARALGYLMTKMEASEFAEAQMIGAEATAELRKVLPKFFDVVDNDRGQAHQNNIRQTDIALRRRAEDILGSEKPDTVSRVELVKLSDDASVNIAAGLLYPYSNLPLRQIIDVLSQMSDDKVGDVIHDSLKFRVNRRHHPPRGWELDGRLVFDTLGNFGIYRDLQRHRILTQQRQEYTTEHGYDMPVEYATVGLDSQFAELMDRVAYTHDTIKGDFPLESQYMTTLGNYTRWYMGMNPRELFHMTELRSGVQGHFSYRTVAQDMFVAAGDVLSFLKSLPEGEQYVDMSERERNLGRMEAMKRIEIKQAQLADRYS